MRELTIQDIETIIRSDENRILEVKKTTGEIDAGMSSGCAFLNTDGGWLLFGIAPKSLKILGQDVTDPTKQEIANHLRKFDPLINPYVQYVDVPESDGKKVIAIYFDPAEYSDVPYSYDGRPYYKVENTTTLMPRQLFERLIRENHPEKFSWEKEICHKAILEDLDAKRIRGTIQAGVNVGRIPSSALQLQDVPAQLAHFKIGDEKDGIHNAAVVLFGKEPTRFFNQCKVRLARFEGTSMRQFRDQTVCEGNLFEQYDAIINFCQKHMFLAGTMETGQRIDTLTVPFLAIRETVLNMLAHRSWWDEDESLSVAIFDDRIEFTNPGHFPIGTSVEDFIETPRSKPQNPDIAGVLFRSGWMESWGRGIANIMEACEQAGLPKPEFIKAPWITRIIFRFKTPLTPYLSGKGGNGSSSEPINEPLNEPLNYSNIQVKTTHDAIKSHPGIGRSGIMAQTGLSLPSVKRYIAELTAKGYIEHRGSKKTGGYFPINKQ